MTAETGSARSHVVETERLFLRRLTPDDAAFMLELMNEPAFIANVADRGLRSTADAANYIVEKLTPSYERFGFGFYVIELKEDGTPIGTCGLAKRDTLDDVDIGYALLARFSGQGYAYEAARAVMEYARTVLRLERVVALTAATNHRSQKVIEKLGLRYERTIELPGYNSASLVFA